MKYTITCLPLTLLNFNTTKRNQTVLLNWQTANEVNTGYFNVQRSLDGTGFMTTGRLKAKVNSTLKKEFQKK